MAEVISWTVDVKVAGGPSMSASPSIAVDGYDVIEVVVDAGDSPDVGVVPGPSTVELLMLTASRYDPLLSYAFDGGTPVVLDGPQLFTGGMIVAAFTDPEVITITNGTPETVTVSVLVGRNG